MNEVPRCSNLFISKSWFIIQCPSSQDETESQCKEDNLNDTSLILTFLMAIRLAGWWDNIPASIWYNHKLKPELLKKMCVINQMENKDIDRSNETHFYINTIFQIK